LVCRVDGKSKGLHPGGDEASFIRAVHLALKKFFLDVLCACPVAQGDGTGVLNDGRERAVQISEVGCQKSACEENMRKGTKDAPVE